MRLQLRLQLRAWAYQLLGIALASQVLLAVRGKGRGKGRCKGRGKGRGTERVQLATYHSYHAPLTMQ